MCCRLQAETRHLLNHHGHRLAIACSLDQPFHQHRLRAGAMDRLLDGDDLWIIGRLRDKVEDRLERSAGMMQQNVAATDAIEEP